jgi:hypothetical protein
VYLPVHLLPLLLFNSPRLARRPLATTARAAEGVLRSSTFLALYCSLGWVRLRLWGESTLFKPLLDFKHPVQTPVGFQAPCSNPC